MRKRDELNDPKSCMSRAREDEMTFVLLGRDAAAPHAIREWCKRRMELGKNAPGDPQLVEAMDCADTMERERFAAMHVTEDMVTRFLNWPLPESVCADLCATKTGAPHRVGTNLLTAEEARQMLAYVLG